MKANPVINRIFRQIIFVLFLFLISESFSQQVIKFKDGTELNVFIKSLTKDTVRYYIGNKPEIVYVERMSNVENIETASKMDSITNILMNNEKYLHYKRNVTTGTILLVAGAIIGTAGVVGYTSIDDHFSDADSFLGSMFSVTGMVVGTGMFLAGTIITIVGSSNMQAYKRQLQGFSFDLKTSPKYAGVTVAYKF